MFIADQAHQLGSFKFTDEMLEYAIKNLKEAKPMWSPGVARPAKDPL